MSKFLANLHDDELAHLIPFLVALSAVPDVRKILGLLETEEDWMDISLLPCLKTLGLVTIDEGSA